MHYCHRPQIPHIHVSSRTMLSMAPFYQWLTEMKKVDNAHFRSLMFILLADDRWYFSLNCSNARCIFLLKCLCVVHVCRISLMILCSASCSLLYPLYHSCTILAKNDLFFNAVYLTIYNLRTFQVSYPSHSTVDINIRNEAAITNSYTPS